MKSYPSLLVRRWKIYNSDSKDGLFLVHLRALFHLRVFVGSWSLLRIWQVMGSILDPDDSADGLRGCLTVSNELSGQSLKIGHKFFQKHFVYLS
jgi:hypothetical protein